MKLINAEELISVFNADEQGLILIDSRMPSDRQLGYIEGSVNLPDTSTDCRNLLELAPVKDRVIAFYCNSAKCRRSGRAVDIALASGYQNILWFKGGLSRMASKKYPVLKLLSNKQNH